MRDRIGAVERVIKAAPARIGGVERKTRIGQRHHQLRPCHNGDFGIHIGGADLEVRAFRLKIADLFQEGGVSRHIDRPGRVGLVPLVDGGLQPVAFGQKRAVLRHQLHRQCGEAGPEFFGVHAAAGQGLFFDEGIKGGADFQPMLFDAVRHFGSAFLENENQA